ncbi:MAG: zinc ribbon domain-containing protein [Candidatus Thermoplasmatota archaeon]|nr:zinc ribbon domain-containing protein [Candidatus Thermoplasmatota archaeon]
MFCRKCGSQIPDDSVFCPKCGAPQNGGSQTSSQSPKPASDENEILKEMKCPNCGAPLSPQPGEAMVVCQYCGTSVTLSTAGWSKVGKHFILDIKIAMKDNALAIAHQFLDRSILHRHLFEKSTVKTTELQYVPYWILDAGFVAQYRYKREEASPGGFVGVPLGGRGGFGGPTVQFNTVVESGTDTSEVSYPVVAVDNLNKYQPPDYIFNLTNKRALTTSDTQGPVKLLNGSVSEEKGRMDGKIRITQWEIRRLQKRVHGFLSADVNVDIADTYLVHIPIWSILFEHKDKSLFLLVDAHNGMVMEELKE